MNIVKGVADLIRRSSSGQHAESSSGSQIDRFTLPTRNYCFSEAGDESLLDSLWQRYENAADKAEKKRLFSIFLRQFLAIYNIWEPIDSAEELETTLSAESVELLPESGDVIVGCSGGHPTGVLVTLTEEVTLLTSLVTELNVTDMQSTLDRPTVSSGLTTASEGVAVLEALMIAVRSVHNCRVLGYYGVVQKLIALLKASVVHLKAVAGAIPADDTLPTSVIDRLRLLQKLLVLVVSLICSFIDLNSSAYEMTTLYTHSSFAVLWDRASVADSSYSLKNHLKQARPHWKQKAVVSVLEAGGLNWLVELLRIIRRLILKEQWMNMSLQYLTLRALYSALLENPRAQNHFRSIGGLEVLSDGLGLLLNNSFASDNSMFPVSSRDENILLAVFHLHVLSLEVLREAVFGNLSNLQFLCENGRVHKFANSFCAIAFMLQEYNQPLYLKHSFASPISEAESYNSAGLCGAGPYNLGTADSHASEYWRVYAGALSRGLCSFILPSELNSASVDGSAGRNVILVSIPYVELSIKWIHRVLHVMFPCIKACSNQDDLPAHLRIFVYTLQEHVLDAFRKVLISSPSLLEICRREGIWELIFSENFFYFGSVLDVFPKPSSLQSSDPLHISGSRMKVCEPMNVQLEIVLFVEFAATFSGTTHNLPEVSALLEALEHCACSPAVANALAKSLLQILRFSVEKTAASLKELNAVSRVLKVACIQVQEFQKTGVSFTSNETCHLELVSPENCEGTNVSEALSWQKSLGTTIELFRAYYSAAEDAKNMILENASCIDYLFDLFWEKGLRNHMLGYIIDLMKIAPTSNENQKEKLYICSKYVETFNQVREKEKDFVDMSIDLLSGMIEMLLIDQTYYQELFRKGECFLHVVSLLSGTFDMINGEKLVLSVLQTLTSLLANNDASKAAFRALVGKGYQTLQSLLLDFCQGHPSEGLLHILLDMVADGNFDIEGCSLLKNEDAIILYLRILQKSSDLLRQNGLNVFLQLLRDSISNRDSCVRAEMLNILLDWFSEEDKDDIILKIAQLVQVIGGHSISGKDIRKIFALLRSEKVGYQQQYCSLLMNSILSMLNEKGPIAFFDLIGNDSGIILRTPVTWPLNRGFTFSCWVRVENFPRSGTMGLFSFLTENGRGCFALLAKDKLIYESVNQKRHCASLHVNVVRKKWHFLCITHSIGRAFSGGSVVRCYIDGDVVSSERCRYPKINEPLTNCTIGAKIAVPFSDEENNLYTIKEMSPFFGQIGPVYVLSDAISSEHVFGIYSLGPSYMYSFLDNEVVLSSGDPLPGGIFDAKDGLASKIIFGINAQASNQRTLYNVSPLMELTLDKVSFEATVMAGTQLCSRRLLQQIIYCVGGVSVFFPLFTQCHWYGGGYDDECALLTTISRDSLTAEVIELVASVLDDNMENQQQMHLLSGFSILGFLLQSVPPQQLNLETLSALMHLFNVVANCGLSELLVKDAISFIFLNPLIWLYTVYKVQREVYMFLIQQFDNDPRLIQNMCRLPRVLDIIRQYYWDNSKSRSAVGGKPLLHPVTRNVIAVRPSKEEIHKIRLLLLSLGEMSLRQRIALSDVYALVAFFETSQDLACIEDILHMVIRAISQKPLLVSFLEQVNSIGGCHVFVNLLQRDYEPVRLLGLQLMGRLWVGLPSEKKGSKFLNLAVGRSRSISESNKKSSLQMQPVFSSISDRLFRFRLTEHLCATLFDVLLGGASPKQVLQKQSQLERQKSRGTSSHFVLPQILVLLFKYLSECRDAATRTKIIADLLDLLDSNPSNIEALVENGWSAWLTTSMELNVVKCYGLKSAARDDSAKNEQNYVKDMFGVVLCHFVCSVKGGWQLVEETANSILVHFEHGGVSYHYMLRDIYEDLIRRLAALSSDENIFLSQPCRDNALYLLRLVDEWLLVEVDSKLPFLASSSEGCQDLLELHGFKDISGALFESLQGESDGKSSSNSTPSKKGTNSEDFIMDEEWWNLYDLLWILIIEMNGKGPGKTLSKTTSSIGPSLGQRARGLVESLNIPAAEMAAVVSGGLGNALGGKSGKYIDKAMLLRMEKCPRIFFHLVGLYLCKASLQRASQCVQQIIPLLPCFLVGDDEQSKNRLQLFIWSLLLVRTQYGMLDDGARFHVVSQLVREAVIIGKLLLVDSILPKYDSLDAGSTHNGTGTVNNLVQKDRVLCAISDEAQYIQTVKTDRMKQLHDTHVRLNEGFSTETDQKRAFEDELRSSLIVILDSDDSRRALFQLACDEEQQNVAEKWLHVFRSLIDERGPWSANPFPNCVIRHWKLDKTEDSWRRRPKLRQNYHFDETLCQPPVDPFEKEAGLLDTESKSGSVMPIPEQMKRFLLKGIRRITDERSLNPPENDADTGDLESLRSEENTNCQSFEAVKDDDHLKTSIQERKDSVSSVSDPEGGEVLVNVQCVLITPKRKLAGHLTVMKNVLHFFGEFLVDGTAGCSVFRNFDSLCKPELGMFDQSSASLKEKFLKLPTNPSSEVEKQNTIENMDKQPKKIKRHRRWNVSKIKAVHWARYLLKYTAIEIFFSNSVAPIFINFASQKIAKHVGSIVITTRNELLYPKGSNRDRTGAISFIDRRAAHEIAETAKECWRRREMTNFEYLMMLNTLSGRTYNDLTQYPVFPWVLADYSSETLDFNKSSTFRDLSKPVGALDSKRFEVFEDRYQNFSDPDIPSFYYGSHYSSMGIVLYYLIRLEPFTALHRNLQGGKFDHADRLFQAIEGTYRNCLSNTSDVKELIPEFFYMPEFLVNSNSYFLGVKQDGEPIGDVCLPPWAKGSPEEFINRNREALESEYVSSNLHHWIDLIFGYKQLGKPAVEAANIFYYLTYEGAVDLETIEDELQRSAIEDQIANFGQTPIQIFRKKHPRRGPPIPIAHPLRFAPGLITLTSIVSSSSHQHSALMFVNVFDSIVVLVNQDLTLSVKMWLTTQLQSGGNFTFSGSQDPLFGIGSDILSPRRIGSPLAERIELGAHCFVTLQTPSENFLISCGNWENSFQVISLIDGKVVQSIRRHKDIVSIVAVTSDGSVLATGSYDTTVMVWQVYQVRAHEKRARSNQSEFPRKDYIIAETPFHILCGHDDIITCLYVSIELDIVISGSRDGTCVFHTLREGRYVRSLRHPSGSPMSKLLVSHHGRLVFYGNDDLSLHLYSINGRHIASAESNGRLNCIELSFCGEFLVCAGDQGQITVRSMNSLEVIKKYTGVGKAITSLKVTPEECFLAGTRDGSLLVYSIDRKGSLPRNSKSKSYAAG